MPQTPKVVCQAPKQYQWEMDDNCFSLENHINSARAPQKQNPIALTLHITEQFICKSCTMFFVGENIKYFFLPINIAHRFLT